MGLAPTGKAPPCHGARGFRSFTNTGVDGWVAPIGSRGEIPTGSDTPITGTSAILEARGAPHYVYINHEAEVVLQMRNFLGIPLVETDKIQAVAFPTEETP